MAGSRGRTLATIAAVLCCIAVASCSDVAAGVGAPAPEPPVPAGLERYYRQQLGWAPCAPFARTEGDRQVLADPAFECARLEVPLDYTAPEGRTAQIAVLRHRTGEGKVGSLVLNPGGPGGSGVALAAQMSATLGWGPFDVVGFDPRGVGASTPAIDCLTDAERDADRAEADFDASPAGVERAEAGSRLDAERCAQRSGGVEVLANAGTRDVARDLDVLRAALGDRGLTYLGYSYGTRIGATYAEMFPGNVRALVLDGAVDPAQDAVEGVVAQMVGFQKAFEVYAADCAREPSCPLGTDPARTTAAFQAVSRPLIDRPVPVRGDTRTLSYTDAVTAVVSALYDTRAWPELTAGLTELRAGDGTTLLRLADGYGGRSPDGTYDNGAEARLVVNCLDGARITDRATAGELARRANEAAPFADAGRGASPALDACAFLPVAPTSRPHVPQVTGLPPVLVVSTTGDPATPYRAGVDLAAALRGRLLTVEGTQHTAAAHGYPCVDDVVAAYLVDLELPAEGARCTLPTP